MAEPTSNNSEHSALIEVTNDRRWENELISTPGFCHLACPGGILLCPARNLGHFRRRNRFRNSRCIRRGSGAVVGRAYRSLYCLTRYVGTAGMGFYPVQLSTSVSPVTVTGPFPSINAFCPRFLISDAGKKRWMPRTGGRKSTALMGSLADRQSLGIILGHPPLWCAQAPRFLQDVRKVVLANSRQPNEHPGIRGVVVRDEERLGVGLHTHGTLGWFDADNHRIAILMQPDEQLPLHLEGRRAVRGAFLCSWQQPSNFTYCLPGDGV